MYFKRLVIFFILFSVSGCSSIFGRINDNKPIGIPYGGLNNSIENAASCTLGAILMPNPFLFILSVPVELVDISSSFILDTILLPLDFTYSNQIDREFRHHYCSINFNPTGH
jgi:uncharacterized protein YceK